MGAPAANLRGGRERSGFYQVTQQPPRERQITVSLSAGAGRKRGASDDPLNHAV
jgi:hypothetical protein